MNVLITGAASGIGKAVSEYLILKGINVFALDIIKIDNENNKF